MDRFDKIYSKRGNSIEGSAIRAILAVTQRSDIVSFAGGLPSDLSIPADIIARIAGEAIEEIPAPVLQYSLTEGLPHLRQYLVDDVNGRYQTQYSQENILITTGSQQAIDLLAETIINRGDVVIVERPTYLAALQIFNKVGAKLVEADCDKDGFIVSSVENLLKKHKVKLIYITPDHQNPSGHELPVNRREALAKLAKKYGVLLFEDGAYREIRFSGKPLPPIASFDDPKKPWVIFSQSSSKILAPGLRVGWVYAPVELITKMTLLKQSIDVHTSGLTQEILYRYLSEGYFAKHLPKIIALYKSQAEAMNAALTKYGKDVFDWQMPNGGLFIWAKVKKKVDNTKLLPEIVKKYKVAYVPGETFYAANPDKQTLRLNFSKSTEKQIEEGIKLLAEAFLVI